MNKEWIRQFERLLFTSNHSKRLSDPVVSKQVSNVSSSLPRWANMRLVNQVSIVRHVVSIRRYVVSIRMYVTGMRRYIEGIQQSIYQTDYLPNSPNSKQSTEFVYNGDWEASEWKKKYVIMSFSARWICNNKSMPHMLCLSNFVERRGTHHFSNRRSASAQTAPTAAPSTEWRSTGHLLSGDVPCRPGQ